MDDNIRSIRSASSLNREALYILPIFAAVALAYYNSLTNGFVYDDVYIIKQNLLIRDWKSIQAIFSTGYWSSTGAGAGGLYRPFTILTYLVEHQIAGLNPLLAHLDNVAIHFLCSVLVYVIVLRLGGNKTGAVVAALLFAVHPVHVEAVANVVGRAELLASLFTLAGFYTFVRPPGRLPWYVISPALFLLGLLSKETAAVLPLIILVNVMLFEREGRGSGLSRIALTMAPYALGALVFLVMRVVALPNELYPAAADQVFLATRGYSRVLVMLKAFAGYMRLSLLPTSLHAYYMPRPPDSLIDPWVILFCVIAGSFAAASPWLAKNRQAYLLFGAWFFIALLPVSNIIPIGIVMAERSMYLPSVSVCAVGGLLISRAASATRTSGKFRPALAALLVLAVLTSFGLLTHARNRVWHDQGSLNEDLVRSYRKIINDFPESGLYYYQLSKTLMAMDRTEEALSAVRKAVELEPGNTVIGAAYHRDLARTLLRNGDNETAMKELDLAERLDPGSADVYYMKGIVMGRRREFARSAGLLEKAASIMPGDPPVHYYLATAYIGLGRYADAVKELEMALRLEPGYTEARRLLERIPEP